MIAVIFEVEPAEGRKQEYFDIATGMRSMLDDVEGFISVERFQSLTDPRKMLSLSFFEDETAVARWRTLSVRSQPYFDFKQVDTKPLEHRHLKAFASCSGVE